MRIALLIVLAAAVSASAQEQSVTIRVGGRDRTYELHVPAALPKGPAPLVVLLHGRLGTGKGMARLTGFDAIADREHAIVAYPDGYRRGWADGRGGTPADEAGIDDVAFFEALLGDVERRVPVDASRVFVAGMSNGGFMTERLACKVGDRIAAIGVVAATLSEKTARECRLPRPLPVMVINGTEDPLVPFAGGGLGGSRGRVLGARESVGLWREWNGCAGPPVARSIADSARDGTSITEETYERCRGGATVDALVVNGGGHAWPGGWQYLPVAVVGRTSRNLDASRALWEFFATKRRSSSVEDRPRGDAATLD